MMYRSGVTTQRCKSGTDMIGRVRPALSALSGYRPGKATGQVEAEHGITNSIKLASNENPWSPVAPVADAIRDAVGGVNRYGDNNATEVCHAISQWQNIPIENLTVGCGSSGLLQQVFMTFVSPGDEVVFPWNSFEIYPVFSTLFDATEVRVPLRDYAFDLDAVADAVTERTSVVFLATPNNPTGTAVSMNEVADLIKRIPDDVIVVIDEAYREFSDPAFGDPVVELLARFPNILVTRTFSKAFGLAGLRSGYAVARPEVIAELNKTRLPFSVNNLAQAAMIAAIEHVDEAMVRVDELLAERDRCQSALGSRGIDIVESQANFVLVPTGERTMELASALEQVGIITRPFPGFGLRITIGTPEQNDRWVDALVGAL